MTARPTGSDVDRDVRAGASISDVGVLPDGSDVRVSHPIEADGSAPVHATSGPAVTGPAISAGPGGQDGGVEPFEPQGRWWTRTPLRVRLVVASVGLVLFALVVIGSSSTIALKRYLLDRADTQLGATAQAAAAVLSHDSQFYLIASDQYAIGFAGSDGAWIPPRGLQLSTPDLPAVPDDQAVRSRLGQPYTVASLNGHYRFRLLITQLNASNGQVVYLVVANNLSNVDNEVSRLILIELLVGFAVLIAMGLASVWVVRMSLRPLVAIERTAGAIAAGDLTQRVPWLDTRTELGQLSNALNTMLNQVESAFQARAASEDRAVRSEERMRQFVADASHELRTPLTTIRGFAELYRQGAAPEPGDVLRRIENEAARMGLLVEDLLMLARLDQERPLEFASVALPVLIADAAAAAHAVDPERAIAVELAEPTDRLIVAGDEARLRQIIGNLVTNALTHTPPGTPVTLRLRLDGPDHAVIEVADEGPGLAPAQAEHVFERFYRVDKARTRQASAARPRGDGTLATPHSGAGLGLAIVAALVAAHNGTVEMQTAPGQGATFRIRLPLAPELRTPPAN